MYTRKGVNKRCIATQLKAARRDAIANLQFLWGIESELQANPMPFHLDSPYVCDGLETGQNTLMVGNGAYLRSILSCLWTIIS